MGFRHRCERLRRGPCHLSFPVALSLVVTWSLFVASRAHAAILVGSPPYHVTGDGCDWTGSGLERESESNKHDVQPAYLRCREGRILWQYPRRGLRVVLALPDGKDFKACFLLHSNTAQATIYADGPKTLRTLFTDSVEPQPIRCFSSSHGRTVLFVEAQPARDSLEKQVVDLSYDLQPTDYNPNYDECRPCSEEELLYHYCTADYVARGTVSGMEHSEAFRHTELRIRATEVFRDTEHRVFRTSKRRKDLKLSKVHYGLLYRPLQCGTKAGYGEFLFLGRWRLGRAMVSCAPRWTEWKQIQQKASLQKTAECELA